MDIEQFREACLAMPNAIETTPFGPEHIVYKTELANGKLKMFALSSLNTPNYVQLKCDPETAIGLRDRYSASIEAGWHMNKAHWNGITLDALPAPLIRAMIAHSHALVAFPSVGDRARRAKLLDELIEAAQI